MEQNSVADYMAAVAARNELLGAVDRKLREAVDRQIREQLQGIRPFDPLFDHVMGLVEKHAAIAPSALLVAPITVFRRNDWVNVGSDLRIAEQVHRIAGGLQQAFKALVTH